MNHLLDVNPLKKLPALSLMLLLLIGTILLAAPAKASTITAKVTYAPGISVKYNSDDWYTEYYLTGTGNYDKIEYDAFCIEDVNAYLGDGVYTIQDPDDNFYRAAWIANNYYTNLWTYNKSEVQSAIWEVLFENSDSSYDVRNGSFYISDDKGNVNIVSINKILSEMEDAFDSISFNANSFHGIKMANFRTSIDGADIGNRQDYIYYDPAPEPATMLLFGVGLIGLAGIIRKKSIS